MPTLDELSEQLQQLKQKSQQQEQEAEKKEKELRILRAKTAFRNAISSMNEIGKKLSKIEARELQSEQYSDEIGDAAIRNLQENVEGDEKVIADISKYSSDNLSGLKCGYTTDDNGRNLKLFLKNTNGDNLIERGHLTSLAEITAKPESQISDEELNKLTNAAADLEKFNKIFNGNQISSSGNENPDVNPRDDGFFKYYDAYKKRNQERFKREIEKENNRIERKDFLKSSHEKRNNKRKYVEVAGITDSSGDYKRIYISKEGGLYCDKKTSRKRRRFFFPSSGFRVEKKTRFTAINNEERKSFEKLNETELLPTPQVRPPQAKTATTQTPNPSPQQPSPSNIATPLYDVKWMTSAQYQNGKLTFYAKIIECSDVLKEKYKVGDKLSIKMPCQKENIFQEFNSFKQKLGKCDMESYKNFEKNFIDSNGNEITGRSSITSLMGNFQKTKTAKEEAQSQGASLQ